ncbi:MAG TPA: hypothetical protein VGI52_06795, partial [Solirubrobacteraceae bacterium]
PLAETTSSAAASAATTAVRPSMIMRRRRGAVLLLLRPIRPESLRFIASSPFRIRVQDAQQSLTSASAKRVHRVTQS